MVRATKVNLRVALTLRKLLLFRYFIGTCCISLIFYAVS